jgi:hypothetical protein
MIEQMTSELKVDDEVNVSLVANWLNVNTANSSSAKGRAR